MTLLNAYIPPIPKQRKRQQQAREAAQEIAEIEKRLREADEETLRALVQDLEELKNKHRFRSNTNQNTYFYVREMIDKTIRFIKQQN